MKRTWTGWAVLVLMTLASSAAFGQPAPMGQGVGPDGWTILQPSADSRVVYVSSSQGNDSSDGLAADRPLKKLAAGFAKLRNGFPDYLLLRRGDVWVEESIGMISAGAPHNGRSAAEPLVIGAYGDAPARPLLKLGDVQYGLRIASAPAVRNIAIVGIAFYDQKGDPSSPEFVRDRDKHGAGVSWLAPGENLLVEDCTFDYITGGSIMGHAPQGNVPDASLKNVQVRRCVAAHAWTTSGHCQGFFFAEVDGLLLEENVLDANGYNWETGDEPTWFNHNVYITVTCDKVVARGNIVARGASTGIYCRTNGILEDNLCLDNTPSLNLGRIDPSHPGGVTGRVAGNVIIGMTPRVTKVRTIRGAAIEVGNVNASGVVVENNIVIGATGAPAAFTISPVGVGVHNVLFRNNTVYDWTTGVGWVGVGGTELARQNLSGIVFRNNLFQADEADPSKTPLIRSRDTDDAAGLTFEGNVYWYEPPTARPVTLKDRELSLQEWAARGKAERVAKVQFADPARDVRTYQRSLGKEPSLEAFLAEARKQSRANWRPEYTARAVIAYVRDGFRPLGDVSGAGAVPAH